MDILTSLCRVGELYLELHRGTLTTHSNIKKGNRRCESWLRATEVACCLALRQARPSYEYPLDRLDKLWQLVLLNQFHDVLPGKVLHHFVAQVQSHTQLSSFICYQGHASPT